MCSSYAAAIFQTVFRANFILVNWYDPPKKGLKKQKVRLMKLTCLFLKGKFKESNKDLSINYPYNSKCEKMILNFYSTFN